MRNGSLQRGSDLASWSAEVPLKYPDAMVLGTGPVTPFCQILCSIVPIPAQVISIRHPAMLLTLNFKLLRLHALHIRVLGIECVRGPAVSVQVGGHIAMDEQQTADLSAAPFEREVGMGEEHVLSYPAPDPTDLSSDARLQWKKDGCVNLHDVLSSSTVA